MMIARHVRRLAGYTPGEQPHSLKVIKLNTNENAYPPSPTVAKTLAKFDLERLRRYPDPDATALREALAQLNGTTADRIFVGNGSDEILALAARAFVENDEAIATLDPSYLLYRTLAAIRNVKWVGATTDELATLKRRRAALFILTNPNAPTGEFTPIREIAAFARRFPGVVIVDEAYGDFAADNAMRLATAKSNRNLVVMRTFSKSFSLAGLRVGYCVGPKPLIDALVKIKDSYNVDAVAQAAALAAVKDVAWMRENVKRIIATRTRTAAALRARGWDVLPSESNFLFAAPPETGPGAAEIFAGLKRRNIFVRYFPGPKTGRRLRITIGTEGQMRKLLKAIDDILQ